MDKELTLDEWIEDTPLALRADPLWKSAYYRMAMYLFDLVWLGCVELQKDYRGREIVHQLVRSSGSICANLEEAYGRGIGTADHIRILRIALGEARETQGWYFRSRHVLPHNLLERRLDLTQQVIALIVTTISHQRKKLPNS